MVGICLGLAAAAWRLSWQWEQNVEVLFDVSSVEHVYVKVDYGCLVLTLAFHIISSAANALAQMGSVVVSSLLVGFTDIIRL